MMEVGEYSWYMGRRNRVQILTSWRQQEVAFHSSEWENSFQKDYVINACKIIAEEIFSK